LWTQVKYNIINSYLKIKETKRSKEKERKENRTEEKKTAFQWGGELS